MSILNQFLGDAAGHIIDIMVQDLLEIKREKKHQALKEGSIEVEFRVVSDGKQDNLKIEE